MVFYEINAKSIINRVASGSQVPFGWTINPYRGCSHSCVYCLAGETPILMADGLTKPLSEVKVGDRVYGTEVRGRYRRYVLTDVLAHWQTVKPAIRIRLEDGTTLVASPDHRFLTDRGWKYVTGTAPGPGQRPYMTVRNRLLGFGAAELRDSAPIRSSARLQITAIEPLGVEMPMFDITTGTGDFIADGVVSHNCFARNTHTYLDFDSGRDFDTQVVVKVNAGAVLRRELAARRWGGHHIAMGTNVDVYQRAEGRYRLMPDIIKALRDFANPFSILTKGTLILRDLDLLREAAAVTDVGISFSVGFVDEAVWRAVEPGTPSPSRRLDAVHTLTEAGFDVGVLMAPILPGLTDTEESIDATVRAIAEAGAASVTPLPLHLRTGAREWYLAWLAREHPSLRARYAELYRAGAYLPTAEQRTITARVRIAARHYGIGTSGARAARELPEHPAPPADEQLTLL